MHIKTIRAAEVLVGDVEQLLVLISILNKFFYLLGDQVSSS